MAKNFNEMSNSELVAMLNSKDLNKLSSEDLFQLQSAAKAAGILTVQYDNMLSIMRNNRTLAEIQNSNNFTDEEKAFALSTRDEYNNKIFENIKDDKYSAKEIMSRAKEIDGQYHFDELSKGELDFLINNGILRMSELSIGKNYSIGEQKDQNFVEDKNTNNLSDDVQKSYNFWNNFNEANTSYSWDVKPLQDNSLKVEAHKNQQTMFTGIDHGNQGFDVVKKENNTEPYAIYDFMIKKAKATNPKAKVRIKDSVKDPVARNKILIACAKNNMEPIGNLPEGFDFEALKEMVKDAKSMDDINALAQNLYTMQDFEIVNDAQEKQQTNVVGAAIIPNQEDKENKVGVAPIVAGGQNQIQAPSNEGNIPSSANQSTEKKEIKSPKRPWWKKVRDALVVGGIALLGLMGIRSCQNQEKLEKRVKDLQEQVDSKAAEDCDALNKIRDDAYFKGLADGKKWCEEENKPKPVVKKKTPSRKTTPVKKTPVKKEPVISQADTVKGPTVFLPGDVVKGDPIIVDNPIYQQDVVAPTMPKQEKKSGIPLEAIDTSFGHEKDNDLMNAVELDTKGEVTADNDKKKDKTLDLSNPAVFNAYKNSIKGNIK